MQMLDRRRPRPNQVPPPASPTSADIDRILQWVAAEVRAERRFPWYVARCPARFIRRCSPGEN